MKQAEIDELCRSVYAETRAFEPIAQLCAHREIQFGFEILMGPPFKSTRLLFIGYQPGDWETDAHEARRLGYEQDWVTEHRHEKCQYATQKWLLAKNMRKMFAGYPGVLENSVGLNAIFVRARNIRFYEASIDKVIRQSIQDFCLNNVKRMIDAIEPEKIVIIGFSTAKVFGQELRPVGDGKLLRTTSVFGRSAFVTPHLSAGVGYSDADRSWMAGQIMTSEAPR